MVYRPTESQIAAKPFLRPTLSAISGLRVRVINVNGILHRLDAVTELKLPGQSTCCLAKVAILEQQTSYTVFFRAALLPPATACTSPAPAALFAAHRFFNAATIAARPAALSLRFGCFAGVDEDDCFLAAAHRFRCASAIALRLAVLILCLLPPFVSFELGAAPLEPDGSMARSSAI
jgi:hypothetical protein